MSYRELVVRAEITTIEELSYLKRLHLIKFFLTGNQALVSRFGFRTVCGTNIGMCAFNRTFGRCSQSLIFSTDLQYKSIRNVNNQIQYSDQLVKCLIVVGI